MGYRQMNTSEFKQRTMIEHRTLALAIQGVAIAYVLANMFFGLGLFSAVMIGLVAFVVASAIEMFRFKPRPTTEEDLEPWDF